MADGPSSEATSCSRDKELEPLVLGERKTHRFVARAKLPEPNQEIEFLHHEVHSPNAGTSLDRGPLFLPLDGALFVQIVR